MTAFCMRNHLGRFQMQWLGLGGLQPWICRLVRGYKFIKFPLNGTLKLSWRD